MEELRYPIGKFEHEGEISAAQRRLWIQEIAALPGQLSEAARGLDGERLDTPYREGGWTVRQVVHHVGDSHMNCLMRFKLALTEEQPAIKPYEEQLWAELADSRALPVEPSLALVSALHVRWTALLESMTDEQFSRAFYHPGSGQVVRLDRCLGMYVWHGKHHTAHIDRLRDRMGW
ncbi:YfiT family bacillithiol transferase [Cohnella sp. JJ-181]|uniref:YfiT family bacillithiol transferase n=1 Tax=Cohnella rhizoplanae TaxID=2974897 RepID=UPI00232D2D58|nr:bacillithiol transferase BstA [Cohnella sp. JJ-181]